MKVLIALLLLASASSFVRWFYPHNSERLLLRKGGLFSTGISLPDNSEIESDLFRKFSMIDQRMRQEKLSASQMNVLENLQVSLGVLAPPEVDHLFRYNSKVTFGAARDCFSAFIERIIAAPDTEASFLRSDEVEPLSKKIHEIFFPNPHGRLESTGPFNLLSSILRFNQPWVLTPELLGKFFGALLLDQKQFDEASVVLLGEDRANVVYQYRSNAIIGEVEEKLAEFVMSYSGSSLLNLQGLDLETEKIFIANYMKNRVVPMWFAHHVEELADLLGLGASEYTFTDS